MKRTASATWAFAAMVLATSISGCSSSSHNSSSPAASASASPSSTASADSAAAVTQATVSTRKAGDLGTILVTQKGRTMYLFEADKSTKSTCYNACAAAWPPVLTTGKPKTGSGAKGNLIGTTKRTGGSTQATYHGHPLYLYAGDSKAGDTHGEGLTQFGAAWYVLSPNGKKVDKS